MTRKFEAPLKGYHRSIGGSAGKGTHGGSIARPKNMPTKGECDYVVNNKKQFKKRVTEDGASVYINSDIDLTGEYNIRLGSDVTLVGGYCDPKRTENNGRGPLLTQKYYNPPKYGEKTARTLLSKWGKAPTLWGVSFRGPNTSYFNPEDRVKSDDWDTDDVKDWYASGLWVYDDDTFEAHGCEFFGWTMAGVEIGSSGHKTTGLFNRCSFHHNLMESLGYGVEQYNGHAEFDKCFFDACRHGISGFGYPEESYEVKRSLIGPNKWCGHALDMHCVDNNLHNGDLTAGKRILIEDCTIMSTRDIGGYDQEGFAIRGFPEERVDIKNCHFYHKGKPEVPNKQGNAYRQEADEWTDFHVDNNVFGKKKSKEGVGAPRAAKHQDENDSTMKELIVSGIGEWSEYEIVVKGNVKPKRGIENPDNIKDNGDGTHTITGDVVGADDVFSIGKDAVPVSAIVRGPVVIELDGKDITAPLVGAGLMEKIDSLETDSETSLTDVLGDLRIVRKE